MGRRLGSFGQMGIFSFDHYKTITTGEGGMVITNDLDLYHRAEWYHDHGHDHLSPVSRALDGIERAFGQVTLSRLLITPMPGVQALCEHLAPLLYVPVAPLVLDDVLDFTAVPELLADPSLLNQQLCAIGAALREPG